MDKYGTRLRYRRYLISDSVMGALIAGMLALTACGGGKGGGKGGGIGGNGGGNTGGNGGGIVTATAAVSAAVWAVRFHECRLIHKWWPLARKPSVTIPLATRRSGPTCCR